MLRTARIAAVSFLVPALAFAAGFEVPENGATVLGQGGSAAGLIDTAYGVAFNPAGLSLIDGLDVRLDYRFVNHAVTFQRAPSETTDFNKVSNTAGIFAAPMVTAAYARAFKGHRFGIGLGVFGPPGVGRYAYTDPRAPMASEGDPGSEAGATERSARTGHRYSLISADQEIIYPSIALSYAPRKELSFGVTFQSAYTHVKFVQSMAGLSNGGAESTDMDAVVAIDVKDTFSPTAVLGAAWSPIEKLRFSASYRPQIVVRAEGSLGVELAEPLRGVASVSGDTTKLALALPPIARFGASYDHKYFAASAEFVYEGWSVNKKFVLTPDVSMKVGSGAAEKMDPVAINKHWVDSVSGRLGGTFKALRPAQKGGLRVDVHAGGLYESNAIPSDHQALDYVTGTRIGGSLGATVGLKGLALTVSGMAYLPVSFDVTDSQVARAVGGPEDPPVIVGNGTYTSSVWIAAVGLSYTGLGEGAK